MNKIYLSEEEILKTEGDGKCLREEISASSLKTIEQ